MNDAVQVTRLPSGLLVVTETMDRVETVSTGGLRGQRERGTRRRRRTGRRISWSIWRSRAPSGAPAAEIAEEVENVGGHINAYTAREQTAYYVKLLKEDLPLGADIIGDILTHSTFAPDELERERGVILQEIGQANDTPDDIIFEAGACVARLRAVKNASLNSTAGGHAVFASTQWRRLVEAAEVGGNDRDPADTVARDAWEALYRDYCYPVYAFIRRRGHPRPEAQDLTQDFFVHLVEKGTLRRADPQKGRFRTFLLGVLEYFLADAARRAGTRKRGGDRQFVFLDDAGTAENAYQLAAPNSQTPAQLFETRWAAALIDAVFSRLREEMAASGKGAQFEALKDYVAGAEDASYQETADRLGLTLAALNSAIHRLRGRYRSLLREEVARTVAHPGEVAAELAHLCAALRTAG